MNGLIVFIIILFFCAILIVGGYFALNFGLTVLENQKKLHEEQQKKLQQQTTLSPQQPSSQQTQPTPTCERGPQSALRGYSCPQIEAISIGTNSLFNNEQNIFMNQKGMDFNNLGYKYPGEVCWSNTIQNCVSPTCLQTNQSPKDLAICKIKYMLKDINNGPFIAFDPWVKKAMDSYKLTSYDLGL